MKSFALVLAFVRLLEASAQLNFRRLAESQSLELLCSPQQDLGTPAGFVLYHRSAQSQTTVLSMAAGAELRVNPEHRGRLRLRGGLDSPQVNVTIYHLQHSDAGLYTWELSYKEEGRPAVTLGAQRTLLLVDGAGNSWSCSHHYLPLLLTILTATALLLLTLSWLVLHKQVKHRPRSPHPVPIYEEMTRKQQRTLTPQNNYEAPSHLEEVHFPVYANPSIRQPQDDYYACPRQLALRASRDSSHQSYSAGN